MTTHDTILSILASIGTKDSDLCIRYLKEDNISALKELVDIMIKEKLNNNKNGTHSNDNLDKLLLLADDVDTLNEIYEFDLTDNDEEEF